MSGRLFLCSALFLAAGLLFQCQSTEGPHRIRSYYFPLADFMDGKVYEYRAVNDSLAPFYWYFRTTISKGDTVLTSEYFDHNFTVQQLTNEQMVNSGMVLNDFYLYAMDSLTGQQIQNPVRVEVDNVYPFEVIDSNELFLYKVFWRDFDNPDLNYRLVKNRHFMGFDRYEYRGESVPCVRFFVKELLEVEEEGFQELTYNGIELYAKNIGLVYFRKEIDGRITQEYELRDVYDMTDLEDKYRATLPDE